MQSWIKFSLLILAMIALPVVGYAVSFLFSSNAHMSQDSTATHVLFTISMIAVGLGVPYGILLLGSHAAHTINPNERTLHLSDIPKDFQQMRKS